MRHRSLLILTCIACAATASDWRDGIVPMEQLALNPEPCAASCLREHRIGSNAWWYIIDAEGKTHLQFAEDAAGAADFPVQRASDGTASIRSVGLDALAPDVSEATGCGR